jgi:hypothetical protein
MAIDVQSTAMATTMNDEIINNNNNNKNNFQLFDPSFHRTLFVLSLID